MASRLRWSALADSDGELRFVDAGPGMQVAGEGRTVRKSRKGNAHCLISPVMRGNHQHCVTFRLDYTPGSHNEDYDGDIGSFDALGSPCESLTPHSSDPARAPAPGSEG